MKVLSVGTHWAALVAALLVEIVSVAMALSEVVVRRALHLSWPGLEIGY